MQHPPKTDALQRYGADLSDFAYSQERVRKMLDDAHAHYEAQVRPMFRLVIPAAGYPPGIIDTRIEAMAEAGKVALLTARNDTLVDAMKDAARTLEGAHLGDGQEVAYVVANGLRRAAE